MITNQYSERTKLPLRRAPTDLSEITISSFITKPSQRAHFLLKGYKKNGSLEEETPQDFSDATNARLK